MPGVFLFVDHVPATLPGWATGTKRAALCPETNADRAKRLVGRHLDAIELGAADDREHNGNNAGNDKAFHE
jgi:hypothetical protein